jgi:hypothetical protein
MIKFGTVRNTLEKKFCNKVLIKLKNLSKNEKELIILFDKILRFCKVVLKEINLQRTVNSISLHRF